MSEITASTRARPPATATARGAGHPGLVLAIVLACQLMLILDVTVMNVALPDIHTALHFSPTGLSWVIDAYALAYGGLLLTGGRAGDLYGRRRLLTAGIALFTLASLLGGLATASGWLLAARVVQGVGAAVAGPSALALLTTTFTEPKARIRALAMFSAISSGGLALGLIVGGALTEWASWRWVLFINVPVGVAITVLAPRYLRADTPTAGAGDGSVHSGGGLDLLGGLTATAGSAALVYAFIRAAASGWGEPLTIGTLVLAVILLGAFVAIEARVARPLVPLRLFADRNRAGGYLIFLLVPAAMLAVFFFLTQILQDTMGFGPMRTGFAFLPLALALFGAARMMPVLLPRFGPKVVATTGLALILAGLLWLSQVDPASGYARGLFGPMLLFGIGAGVGMSPINVVIMATVPRADAGAASGLLQAAQQVGGALGLAVLVTVYGRAGGDLVHRMSVGFAAAAVFTACALLVALTLRRPRA